jgi:hypothetical protein
MCQIYKGPCRQAISLVKLPADTTTIVEVAPAVTCYPQTLIAPGMLWTIHTIRRCAGVCDDATGICYCDGPHFGRVPAPEGAQAGRPPIRPGRLLHGNCQRLSSDDKGQQLSWGVKDGMSYDDIYGAQVSVDLANQSTALAMWLLVPYTTTCAPMSACAPPPDKRGLPVLVSPGNSETQHCTCCISCNQPLRTPADVQHCCWQRCCCSLQGWCTANRLRMCIVV